MNQKGFTLIELVIVIAIIGILAAVALPKYVSLEEEAHTASLQGIAGNLSASSMINQAVASANPAKAQNIADCADTPSLLVDGLATGYSITAAPIAAGEVVSCVLNGPGGRTENFTGVGVVVP